MIKINSFSDLKGYKEEERINTISNFEETYKKITSNYRNGLISDDIYYKELCKLISKTGLHIDVNYL